MEFNEMLFYGGIVIVIVSLVILLVYICLSRAAVSRLQRQLRKEYGEEER